MIRTASINDVPRISDIINSHAELGKMLFKSYAQLFEDLRDFAVYQDPDTGEVVGCVALSIIWADLTEVRSLAVDEGQRGKGIGSKCLSKLNVQLLSRVQNVCLLSNVEFKGVHKTFLKAGMRRTGECTTLFV